MTKNTAATKNFDPQSQSCARGTVQREPLWTYIFPSLPGVQVALDKMKGVTAIHLVRRANPAKPTTVQGVVSKSEGE